MEQNIPIWEKSNLTIEEASLYFNIGTQKLRKMTEKDNCPFVLWVGRKRLIKRVCLEEYLRKTFSI